MRNSSHVWDLLSYAMADVLIWVAIFLFVWLIVRMARAKIFKGQNKGGKNRQ